MELGSENFFNNIGARGKSLSVAKVGIVANQASVNSNLQTVVSLLHEAEECNLTCILAPQHGYFGEKQDNMIEATQQVDHVTKLPIRSLYGKNKLRPDKNSLNDLDVIIYDLQDVGVRIYTFVSTLLYLMQLCQEEDKKLILLDRPNPIGRQVDGFLLSRDFESFVGAAPIPLQYGLTVGELAKWYQKNYTLNNLDLEIVPMKNYKCGRQEGVCNWPKEHLHWVPPSPNLPTLEATRCYPGTVLLEGTLLSEGRGTTLPLHQFGAPQLDVSAVLEEMKSYDKNLVTSMPLRVCYFEPTYHKFTGENCSGLQIMTGDHCYKNDNRPFLLMACFFKAIKKVQPELMNWRQPPYEYEYERLPIDLINGNEKLKKWIDEGGQMKELSNELEVDHKSWLQNIEDVLMYSS